LPIFGKLSDEEAIEKAKEIFPDKMIVSVMSNEPARDTGIINCLTWNIKK
jgi:agmatine deiminase